MASVSDIPKEAGVSPKGKNQVLNNEGGAIGADTDAPAPQAPSGAGKGAIGTDSDGGKFDKVYGVRPKTTWHLKNPKSWNIWEFVVSLDICPDSVYQRRDPKLPPRGPPPYRPMWEENAFIFPNAMIPLVLHAAWNYFNPTHLIHWAPAMLMYHLLFINYAHRLISRLHKYMAKYGCFDEDNRGRDMIDDRHVNQLGRSIYIYTVFRTIGPFILGWKGEMVNPLEGLSLMTPVKLGLWHIALDFWFYLYHRSCHEFDSIWWIHRQHHATKHPTPILSIFAEDVQECLEIFIIPSLATLITPKLSFPELYLTICYTLYVEALGHSGIRADWPHPILGMVLRPFGMELAVEDHDLHHRFGKSGKNYGKQTRIFDAIFNTKSIRLEGERK